MENFVDKAKVEPEGSQEGTKYPPILKTNGFNPI